MRYSYIRAWDPLETLGTSAWLGMGFPPHPGGSIAAKSGESQWTATPRAERPGEDLRFLWFCEQSLGVGSDEMS